MKLTWTTNVLTYPKKLDIMNLSAEDKIELQAILEQINVPNKDYILNHIKKGTYD
jgi:hypothetical protein